MWLALFLIGTLAFTITMWRGQHPFPFGINGERHGENPGLFWFAVIIEVAFAAAGFVGLLGIFPDVA